MSLEFKEISETKTSIIWKSSEFDSEKYVLTDEYTDLKDVSWYLGFANQNNELICELIGVGYSQIWQAKVRTKCRFIANDNSIIRSLSSEFTIGAMDPAATVLFLKIPDNVIKGDIILECDFEILEISGNYPDRHINFWAPNYLSSTIIKVGEKEFHVSKDILSIQSPVFRKFLDSGEDNREILHLKDHSSEYFADYLYLLYNRGIQIDDEMVNELLTHAQDFQTPSVTQKCEQYLLAVPCKIVSLEEKKMYAEKYGLKDLAKDCEKMEEKTNPSVFSGIVSYFSDKLSI